MMEFIKKIKFPLVIVLVFIALMALDPEIAAKSATVSVDYFTEMVLILPPVFILMGLMEIWIPKHRIQSWLGDDSGFKGALLSLVLGTLPTGPLYVAFPMAASLLHKGASITNIIIFLGSWAALKIPQLMVEIKFLGLPFTILRFVLTLVALVVIGEVMKIVLQRRPMEEWLPSQQESSPKMPGKMNRG